jgi:hypothetical protein
MVYDVVLFEVVSDDVSYHHHYRDYQYTHISVVVTYNRHINLYRYGLLHHSDVVVH